MSLEADRLGVVGRLDWTRRASSSCTTTSSTTLSVKAVLKDSTGRRLRLTRSSLGGGLVPTDDYICTTPQQSYLTPYTNNSGSSSCDIINGESFTSNNRATTLKERVESFSAFRFKKQRDIAHVLPMTDVKRMTREHWMDIFSLERRYLPMDWYQPKESPILGVKQSNINRDHRHRIVKWMGEACGLFKWTTQTFFTAVHAWDVYITVVPHEVTTAELAKLSAACLYYGAQLVESAADENVKPLEEFTELCPEVGSTAAVREIQAHLVDTLQGISLVRRTPMDFLLLFLAQMQIAPSPCPELFESILHQNLLDVLWDIVLAVTFTIYANGLVLDGLPGSRWVAGSMLRVLEYACPALRLDINAREIIRRHVFHLPAEALEAHRNTVLDPIITKVWQLIVDSTEAAENNSNNNDCGRSRGSQTSNKQNQPCRRTAPYEIIRHHLPLAFPQWPITFPNNKIVQDVSTRLRAASFETCTPPTFYATGLTISASKRTGEKTRKPCGIEASAAAESSVRAKESQSTEDDEAAVPRRSLIMEELVPQPYR